MILTTVLPMSMSVVKGGFLMEVSSDAANSKRNWMKGALNVPAAKDLPGTKTLTPFVFVADDAFPLCCHTS